MTRLILVRHGETTWNDAQRFQGHTDVPLSARGWRQTERLAERFTNESIAAVYSSDLARAYETAQVIANRLHMQVVCEPGLREAQLGELQGLEYAEVRRRWFSESDPLPCYFVNDAPPGVESLRQLQARVMVAVNQIAVRHCGETALIVMHGACLRAVFCAWLDIELSEYRKLEFDAGAVSQVQLDSNRIVVTLLNDSSHLKES